MRRILSLVIAVLCAGLTVHAEKSPEAQALLNVLNGLQDEKVIVSTMANVNWNITEAENVYAWTGKWPAMTTFDFIHAPYSKDVNPQGWLDYSDMTMVSDWWQNGGIVSCMWHWLQKKDGSNDMSFYTSETSFDPSKISDPTSAEYAKMVSDMDQIAGYFQQMKALGIPVVWRPLHEAAGNSNVYQGGTGWFWWGSKGGEAFKQLWRFMHDYFTNTKGLDNLIWVWNGGIYDDGWYPGDEYVDVVGDDYYGSSISSLTTSYAHLRKSFPSKLAALTECGHSGNNRLPSLQRIWEAGAKWLWAMPWYDYAYNDANNTSPTHHHGTNHTAPTHHDGTNRVANKEHDYHDWFVDAMQLDYAVDRTTMKALLDAALTAVNTPVVPTPAERQPLFDLQGRRVNNASKPGLYISNGRIVAIPAQK